MPIFRVLLRAQADALEAAVANKKLHLSDAVKDFIRGLGKVWYEHPDPWTDPEQSPPAGTGGYSGATGQVRRPALSAETRPDLSYGQYNPSHAELLAAARAAKVKFFAVLRRAARSSAVLF